MEEELIMVVSTDTQEGRDVCKEISEKLRKKGLNSFGPATLPKVPIPEAKSVVLNSNPTSKDKYDWLQDLGHDTVLTLGSGNSSVMRGYSVKFQRRINYDAEDLYYSLSDYSVDTNVQISRNKEQSTNQTNSPFSYDPAQDFVTEM
jgi:hypothetical protein